MEFKVIFFSMALTLVVLFILTHFYRKNENVISKLEVHYYEKLTALRKRPSDNQLKQEVIQAAKDYAAARNLSTQALEKMIQQDLPDHQ